MLCEQLAFVATEQLIQELLSRTTFVGLVIRSKQEAKGMSAHRCFMAECSRNLQPDQALTILDGIVGQLKEAG